MTRGSHTHAVFQSPYSIHGANVAPAAVGRQPNVLHRHQGTEVSGCSAVSSFPPATGCHFHVLLSDPGLGSFLLSCQSVHLPACVCVVCHHKPSQERPKHSWLQTSCFVGCRAGTLDTRRLKCFSCRPAVGTTCDGLLYVGTTSGCTDRKDVWVHRYNSGWHFFVWVYSTGAGFDDVLQVQLLIVLLWVCRYNF